MSKRSGNQRIADIYTNIESARRYIAGITFEQFQDLEEKQQAVLHRLQNASEAATRLKADWPDEYARLERDHPEVSWQRFRDLGNRYRHGYDQINLDAVWGDLHGYTIKVQRALQNDVAMLSLPVDASAEDGHRAS